MFLQNYVNNNYKNLFNIDTENITGFRIDKKNGNGNYSIVFHVANKKQLEEVPETKRIPSHFFISFPDGINRKIKTDVEETGASGFHFSVCQTVLPNGDLNLGTVGVFVRQNAAIYAVTNYHVAAWSHMLAGNFSFNGDENGSFIDNQPANLILGLFSNEIDAAFIRVADPTQISNQFANGMAIKSFAKGPITPGAIGQMLTVYSRSNPQGINGILKNNSAVFNTRFRNLLLNGVIQIDRLITTNGDSGSPVMVNDILVGIIVGGDESYSYAIPFHKIWSFNPIDIL